MGSPPGAKIALVSTGCRGRAATAGAELEGIAALHEAERIIRALTRHPFPVACSVTAILLAVLAMAEAATLRLGGGEFATGAGVAAVPVGSWLVARALGLVDGHDVKTVDGLGWQVGNGAALAAVIVSFLFALTAHLIVMELRELDQGGVAGQAAQPSTPAVSPPPIVAPSATLAPAPTPIVSIATLALVNPDCGALPARYDATLTIHDGYRYWMTRADFVNPGLYAVGPPRKRTLPPQLSFDVVLPLCERPYQLTLIECDDLGNSLVAQVVAASPDAPRLPGGIPPGCVVLLVEDVQAFK